MATPLMPASRFVYLRLEDPAGKHKPVITQHLVWNFERFLQSQMKAYMDVKDEADRRIVTPATRAEYMAQHKKAN
ncbi:hypothetical protein V8Z80_08325 [Orrella sp. JC864]|uniref:hypothetical protein n=1 Tax=Orrella sp. JC864 TaxID=3120298 RepID=UPI003009DA8F